MDNLFLNIADWIRGTLDGWGFADWLIDASMVFLNWIVVLVFLILNVLFLVYMERRVCSFFQERLGPNRLGPKGLFQTVIDILKLLGKELITPANVDRPVYKMAALGIFIPSLLVFLVVPFGEGMAVVDLNIGILFMLSVASISTIFILMAGWGSNNKYSLMGGMRAVAQMVSYEIPLVFSFLGIIMLTGSLRMSDIVGAQDNLWFIVLQPIAFIIYVIAGNAEMNRGPFDLPEGEQELVAGYHLEYTGVRFALFYLAEYTNLVAMSAIGATVFLGGWQGPFLPGWLWFFLKMYLMIWIFMWIKWTYPRIRIDKMMKFNWKFLLPVALANIVLTGLAIKAASFVQLIGWW